MSDGDAKYPEDAMEKFKNDESIYKKSTFYTVAFGVKANS